MIAITLYLLLFLVAIIFIYCKNVFKYWEKKGVASLNPLTPAGDFLPTLLGRRNIHILLWDHYKAFKSRGLKFGGLYFTLGPTFFPVDVELIKRMLQNDFEYFQDRGTYHNEEEQPLSEHLFSMEGEKWRNLRKKITPIFTSGKLKAMFPTLQKYSKELVEVIKQREGAAVNVTDLIQRYNIDIIVDCFFGIEEHYMINDKSVYMDLAHRISTCSIGDFFKVAWSEGLRNPGNLLKALFMDVKIYEFFKTVVMDIIEYRNENNQVRRNDFIDSLVGILEDDKKSEANPLYSFKLNDIVAQVVLFFTGGFETSSVILSCCIYELANNQRLQEKLRKEILTALSENNDDFSYSMIAEFKSLDDVFAETLRMHTVASTLNRMCVKDYKIPGTNVTIDKGTPVLISALGFHHDPETFPEPEKFDPDRFADKDSAPYCLGFGAGPRACIGRRFAEIQMKLVIARILSSFRLTVNEKTGPRLIVDDVTQHLLLQYKNQIWINFEQIR